MSLLLKHRHYTQYNQAKYIGVDVHQATISVAVMDGSGKLMMECLLETKAATMVEFIAGLQGTLSVTFEEGTSAAWLHDLLKPHIHHVVVCNPRKAALLKDGNKSDRIDARKLAELLRTHQLKPVYHWQPGCYLMPTNRLLQTKWRAGEKLGSWWSFLEGHMLNQRTVINHGRIAPSST